MNYTDLLIFIVKYTPFWAVPLIMICISYAYLYWLKDYKEVAYIWIIGCVFCFFSIIIYFMIGGPDQIVQTFIRVIK